MFKVALTGGIGSGKSEAGEIFAKLGAIVVDSDQLSREVIERGTPGFEELIKEFGDQVTTNGEIDRSKLAEIIFKDGSKRNLLEKIVHPRVRQAFEEVVSQAGPNSLIINEIPLLVETNGMENFDAVIAISAPEEVRKGRLISKGMNLSDIERRMAAQVTDAQRELVADYIIDNSGDENSLTDQIEIIFQKLVQRASSN
jgi:dephospho-CoA kinase